MEQTDQRTDEQTPDLRCFAISSVNAVSVTSRLNQLSSNDSALVRAAQYCDEHVCLSVCQPASTSPELRVQCSQKFSAIYLVRPRLPVAAL